MYNITDFQERDELSSSEARDSLRDILDFMQSGAAKPIVVTRYGRPVAAIIPYSDYIRLKEEGWTDSTAKSSST